MFGRVAAALAVASSALLGQAFAQSDDTQVDIPDSTLRAAIETELGKETNAPITVAEMESLTSLIANESAVADLTGLEHATGLVDLKLGSNRVADVTPLAGLTSLAELWLTDNRIADVAPLAGLTSLTRLHLNSNEIADVTPLTGLESLTVLVLSGNEIADVTPLAGLTSLNVLWLTDNRIADVTPLAGLTSLTVLGLSGNEIADVTPLAGLTSLTRLHLDLNEIGDVTSLAGLTSLVVLSLDRNEITEVAPLSGLTSLVVLLLHDNEIAEVTPLAGLTSLDYLQLAANRVEDISPLVDNPGLGGADIVHVWRNPLNSDSRDSHVPALEERAVVVVHAGHDVPFIPVASDALRQGFVRTVNKTPTSGWAGVWIYAVDDPGESRGVSSFNLGPDASRNFNSDDLEGGNPDKLAHGVGEGQGGWRLELFSSDTVEVSAYIRTGDGFLTSMNALAPATGAGYRIATFNPGSNQRQASSLRLANPGYGTASVTVRGVDDLGEQSSGSVRVVLAPGQVRWLTARELESGEGLDGALGDGAGKWRLDLESDEPIQAMSLLQSPAGHLTNLSIVPDNAVALSDGRTRHRIPLFPAADDADGRQGFARVVNRGEAPASIRIDAFEDTGRRRGPATLTVPGRETVHFNSDDLEDGNADKGLPGGVGSGTGDWRLDLTTAADIEVLSYVRGGDGFLTAMHDTVRGTEDGGGMHEYEVAIFNPGGNRNQVSRLRTVNAGSAAAELTITGVDDDGVASNDATAVRFMLGAGEARTVTARELESGDGLDGALGDGAGKWRLLVRSDRPVQVMNLLSSPTGHLTNLSDARYRYDD